MRGYRGFSVRPRLSRATASTADSPQRLLLEHFAHAAPQDSKVCTKERVHVVHRCRAFYARAVGLLEARGLYQFPKHVAMRLPKRLNVRIVERLQHVERISVGADEETEEPERVECVLGRNFDRRPRVHLVDWPCRAVEPQGAALTDEEEQRMGRSVLGSSLQSRKERALELIRPPDVLSGETLHPIVFAIAEPVKDCQSSKYNLSSRDRRVDFHRKVSGNRLVILHLDHAI
jgi:hypothetical protein